MEFCESQTLDLKSIRKIDSDKGIKDLAISCVSFANSNGGELYIGFEDKTHKPLSGQTISNEKHNEAIKKLKSNCYNVALESSDILETEDGEQYFIITVYPSVKSYASTSDGRYYIRVGDQNIPMRSEDFQRVAYEKESYQWESVKTKYVISEIPEDRIHSLCEAIRTSDRVKTHIKQMADYEVLENYMLVDEGRLTNLGVLWLGDSRQRSRLNYPITVQYIVYDAQEQKIRKIDWHDNTLNPEQLLHEIEAEATELKYSFEVQIGLFRKSVRQYNHKVIRELLINAFAHKSYTISGDVMIAVYPDRLEISNPGSFPLGVTKNNILHQRIRRNPHLIRLMSDLCLMEGEGSGYDLIYELNAMDAKQMPIPESDFNNVTIIQYSAIQNQALLPLFDFVNRNYPTLSQKNLIALGLIAVNEKISSIDLSKILQLSENDRLRSYVENLVNLGIIVTRGVKKGTQYVINPRLISNAQLNIPTTLKTIEPHRLNALIEEDLRLHPDSMISEIANRLPDIARTDIQRHVYNMVRQNRVKTTGSKTNRRYSLA
ncbi:MAG: putative DNA binding domain-containing protein [Duncaniella sp.]|nr:putative DNA binding domain-containing protein [Duncaniella sp.]MDE6581409.1 putative DNA binding domain-containing protein [Duncaniella sp.]